MGNRQSKYENNTNRPPHDGLEERRMHTNANVDQILNSSARNAERERLSSMRIDSRQTSVHDGYRNYDREAVIQREINRAADEARARMNEMERHATLRMEEQRRRNVNWCGRSNANEKSKNNKK